MKRKYAPGAHITWMVQSTRNSTRSVKNPFGERLGGKWEKVTMLMVKFTEFISTKNSNLAS
jgi:hypothetical protein